MDLIDTLKEFEKNINKIHSKEDLQKIFYNDLAPAFLYGGYIKVREDFKVYIKTVEFYFHSEKSDGIHDPIMYHRNIRNPYGTIISEVPYFQIMSLNSHDSGYDITFESEKEQYRASVLIRSYEVKTKDGQYLEWDKKSMFVKHPTYKFNTQSLYLRKLLNGFSLGNNNDIKWVDSSTKQTKELKVKTRQNVLKSKSDFVYDKIIGEKCTRNWSFTREDEI